MAGAQPNGVHKTSMKEAVIDPHAKVTIQDSPIPTPGPHELLVKVIVAGTNSKDWKLPAIDETTYNSGDDVAGIVEAVGEGVFEFRPGDRVAGMHAFPEAHGAYAEYAILPDHQTFRLPPNISFEEGATIPLTAMAAALALFNILELPASWQHCPRDPIPLIIYGASSAVGAYAIKLAVASKIHPIVAIGSSNSEFVKSELKPKDGDTFIDYTEFSQPSDLVNAIKQAFMDAGIEEGRASSALDAVSRRGTFDDIVSQAMAGEPINGRRPRLAVVIPGHSYKSADPSVDVREVYTGIAHQGGDVGKRFAYVVCRLLSLGLSEGWLTPHPYEVREEGLAALEEVLKDSKEGKIRGKKIVLRIAKHEQ